MPSTNLAQIFFKNACQIVLESASALCLPFVTIDMRQAIGSNANSSATALQAMVLSSCVPWLDPDNLAIISPD